MHNNKIELKQNHTFMIHIHIHSRLHIVPSTVHKLLDPAVIKQIHCLDVNFGSVTGPSLSVAPPSMSDPPPLPMVMVKALASCFALHLSCPALRHCRRLIRRMETLLPRFEGPAQPAKSFVRIHHCHSPKHSPLVLTP